MDHCIVCFGCVTLLVNFSIRGDPFQLYTPLTVVTGTWDASNTMDRLYVIDNRLIVFSPEAIANGDIRSRYR